MPSLNRTSRLRHWMTKFPSEMKVIGAVMIGIIIGWLFAHSGSPQAQETQECSPITTSLIHEGGEVVIRIKDGTKFHLTSGRNNE